ncbi:MAG TPA: molybdate ABC transporter substrate-binding protein [Rhizomicrobium sp.]
MPSTAALKMLAGGGMTAPLNALAPAFEAASGRKVEIVFAATPELIRLAVSGAPFDLAVAPADVFRNAKARAMFTAGPIVGIARVGFGVAVRAGAPKPDLSTPDTFRQALLAARSVALLPESAAGAYVLSVFARLGIAEAMKARTLPQTAPAAIAQAVARGEAELGIFLSNVLVAPGVDYVGPFPGELQQPLRFEGAIAAASAHAAAAQAFLDYLQSPQAKAVIAARGMTAG